MNALHPIPSPSECSTPSGMLCQVCERENLWKAWEAVKRNNGAPGVDHRRISDIQPRIDKELHEIGRDLREACYQPGPLISFPVNKPRGGVRELTISTVRDRIVARALSQVLCARCNGLLSPHAYAYRPHCGTRKAVSALQQACRTSTYVLRADIEHFFDEIDHGLLTDRLRDFKLPEDMIRPIQSMVSATRFDGVESILTEKGVPQGSPLSPFLANLYLTCVDQRLEQQNFRFLRYADDLALLTRDIDEARAALALLTEELERSRLHLSTAKTRIYRVDDGFLFLGFLFNRERHTASSEARERLREKLSAAPRADELPEEYTQRRQSIERGWKNYFDPESAPAATPEPAASTRMEPPPVPASDSGECREASARDWKRLRSELASGDVDPESEAYREGMQQLAQFYMEAGLTAAAQRCREEAGDPADREQAPTPLTTEPSSLEAWLSILTVEGGCWKMARVDRLGRLCYREHPDSGSLKLLRSHVDGSKTISVPLYDRQNRVRFGVVDLDISQATLMRCSRREREQRMEEIRRDALAISQRAREVGVPNRVESSGYKGYHIWFVVTERIPAAEMLRFLQELLKVSGTVPEGCHRELFPASAQVPQADMHTHIKWIGGVHPLSGSRARLLTEQGEAEPKQELPHPDHFSCTPHALRSAISVWTRLRIPPKKPPATAASASSNEKPMACLCRNCPVLRSLVHKAETRNDLTHGERCVVRGILEGLPNGEGRRAVHDVIRHCGDYDPKVTDSFLDRGNGKPMACSSIREILGDVCEQVGCNCRFRKLKNDYAHPLRHLRSQTIRSEKSNAPTPNRSSPSETDSLHDLLAAYHTQRNLLLELGQKLEEYSDKTLSFGTLEATGPDPELKQWVVRI